jgi:uncharacterized protein
MKISMYQASAPVFVRALKVLKGLLDKGEASGVPVGELVEGRLHPEMFSLVGQIQRASDSSKSAVARLTGLTAPSMADEETTMEELKARVQKTIDWIESVPESAFEGSESREVKFQAGPYPLEFTGLAYLLGFAIPNFFFHITTAYGILRMKGVPIGKMDYLQPPA